MTKKPKKEKTIIFEAAERPEVDFTYDESLEPIVAVATNRLCDILKKEPKKKDKLEYYTKEVSMLYTDFFYNCCLQHQCLMCCSLAWTEVNHRAMSQDDEERRPHGTPLH